MQIIRRKLQNFSLDTWWLSSASTRHILLHHLAWYKFLALWTIYVFNLWFKNAVSSWDYAASNITMISEELSGKDVDASHFSGTSPAVAWHDWGKPRKTRSEDSHLRPRYKLGSLEYEAALATQHEQNEARI